VTPCKPAFSLAWSPASGLRQLNGVFRFSAGCSISKTSDRFRKSRGDSEIGAADRPQITHLLITAARLHAATE